MHRFFLAHHHDTYKETVTVSEEQAHQITHVLRAKIGDCYQLASSDGYVTEGVVQKIEDGQVTFLMTKWQSQKDQELPYSVSIVCSLLKGDKLDWVVQKATELGVQTIYLTQTRYSVVKWDVKKQDKKVKRLQKIAQEAAEQAKRAVVPEVIYLADQNSLRAVIQCHHSLIAAESYAYQGLHDGLVSQLTSLKKGAQVLCFFGPEGGWDVAELHTFSELGVHFCSLGPRILRAETAPLYFLTSCSVLWELQ